MFQKLKEKRQYLIILSGLLIITGVILYSTNKAKALGSTTGFNNYYNIGDANLTYSPDKPLLIYGIANSSKEPINIGGTLSVARMTPQSSAILDNIDSWLNWFDTLGFTNEQVRPANVKPDSLVGIDRNNSSKGAFKDLDQRYDYEDVFWVSTDWSATKSDSLWFFHSLSLALVGSTSDPTCTQMGGLVGGVGGWSFPDGLKTCESLITWPDNGVIGDGNNNIYKFGQAYPVASPGMNFDDLVSKIKAQDIKPVSSAVPGNNVPDIYKLYIIPQTKLTCSSLCTTKTVANLTQQGVDSLKQLTVKVYAAGDDPSKDPNLNTIDDSSSDTPATSSSGGTDTTSSATGTALNFLADWVISPLIQLVTTIIYWIFSIIVSPLIEAVLAIHPYKDVFVQVIYPGWLILRNLSNIAFIIVLLVIGMATLFQVEKYNYKHLLVKVIIAAVLVNFSLVIGQAVLGVADTVQNQFLPENSGKDSSVIRALGYELMVKPVQQIQTKDDSAGGGLSNITYPFFLLSLALGAFLAFVAILIFLVVRIVGLWILLMVSPIAYVANVLPETEKYFSEWWSKFLAYAFITPIFAFFLNIAALFATSHVFGQGSPVFNANNAFPNISDFVYLTAGHITVLVFLFAGLSFAGSSGVIGAKAITDFAKKGMKLPFAAGAALGKWIPRRGLEQIHAAGGPQLNPWILKKQWDEYSHHKQQERLNRGEAKGNFMSNPMDDFETFANWKGVKRLINVRRFGNAKEVSDKLAAAKDRLASAQDVKTPEEIAALKQEIADLELQQRAVSGGEVSTERARELSRAIAQEISSSRKDAKSQADEAKNLKNVGVADGDPELVEAQRKSQEAKKRIAALTQLQSKLDQEIGVGRDKVNMNLIKQGLDAAMLKLIPTNLLDGKKITESIQKSIDKINGDLENNDKARIKLNIDANATTKQVNDLKDSILARKEDLEHKLVQVRRPEAYYARLARTAAAAEEGKKLAGIDDAEELKRLLENAVHEKNTAKAEAIWKKLAKDLNFNEVLEGKDLHGNDILADAEGMKRYFDKMAKQMGMSDTHKFQVASEVGYINEAVGGAALGRITKVTDTGMDWNSRVEHEQAAYGENSKKAYREQAKLPRWNFVRQKRDPKTGGWITVGIQPSSMAAFKQISGDPEGAGTEYGRNFRANNGAAVANFKGWREEFKKENIAGWVHEMIEEKSGEEGTKLHAGGIDFGGPIID